MRRVNSLNFIPDNVKYFDGFSAIALESGFLTLDEKIKKDPVNREKFRCESKISSGGNNPTTRRSRRGSDNSQSVSPVTVGTGVVGSSPAFDNSGEKNYIKNMTKGELILDFHPNPNLKKGEMPQKPKVIKRFMGKWEIKDYLDHHVLRNYYHLGLITDVTEAQMRHEMVLIKQEEEREAKELEAKKMRARQYREENPHSAGELRRLTADGVDIVIRDTVEPSVSQGFSDTEFLDIKDGGSGQDEQESFVNVIIQNPVKD